jgi:hypothetical protein
LLRLKRLFRARGLLRIVKVGAFYFGARRFSQQTGKTGITQPARFARLRLLAAIAARPVAVFGPVLMPP